MAPVGEEPAFEEKGATPESRKKKKGETAPHDES